MAPSTYDLSSVVSDVMVRRDGIPMMAKSKDELSGKTVGLYFSASWCPPCKAFTPKLMAAYNDLNKKDIPFEVVLVSSDRTQNEFDGYWGKMPWIAVPFSSPSAIEKLSKDFGVTGIPCLVMLDAEGNVLSNNARAAVLSGGAADFPWKGNTKQLSQNMQILKFFFQIIGSWLLIQFLKVQFLKWQRNNAEDGSVNPFIDTPMEEPDLDY